MVAAAGNAGPKSPPLYPAANPNVIAVSATDAQDKLFAASNRGSHIALAAPGVDIFLPAPDEKYQMTSGTSFSAAYVSGLAALMLERNPALKPSDVRAILTKTARDLGAPGRDDLFGAGEADAFAAVTAVVAAPAGSGGRGFAASRTEKVPAAADNASVSRALNEPARRAWRRTNRPQTTPIAPRRSDFGPPSPEQKVKKIARRFERPASLPRLMNVGAVIPPHRGCIRRERPSTPSAHMA